MLLVARVSGMHSGAGWDPVTRGVLDTASAESFSFRTGWSTGSKYLLSCDPADPVLVTAIRAFYALLGVCTYKPRAVCRSQGDVLALDGSRREVRLVPSVSRKAVVGLAGNDWAATSTPSQVGLPGTTWCRASPCRDKNGDPVPRRSYFLSPRAPTERPVAGHLVAPFYKVG